MKAVRSWSKPDDLPDLIARKQVDWSVLQQGATIPLEFIEEFEQANHGHHIARGERKEVVLLVGGDSYDAALVNVNRQVASDTLRIMWTGSKEFRSLLTETFTTSLGYIEAQRSSNREDAGAVVVPDDKAEYIDFFQTEKPFCYLVKLHPRVVDSPVGLFARYVVSSNLQYSYKLVLLRAMLAMADDNGGVDIDGVVDSFRDYYLARVNAGLVVDRQGAAINNVLAMSIGAIRTLVLDNPFGAYSRAGWMQRVGEQLRFSPELWDQMTARDKEALLGMGEKRLDEYYKSRVVSPRQPKSLPIAEVLEQVHRSITASGFQYSQPDLANFYLSLRTKPFVILAGISGTGKSQLPRLFANAITAEAHPIPVRPDWNDGSDLLGYVDLEGSFRKGRLTELIMQAKKNPDTPLLVVLDEMNLARVEHYLSDLLSVMESRAFKPDTGEIVTDRLITNIEFKNPGDVERFGALTLPDNLYIVGTVNMDETTHPFSKKVLDRANTIEFSDVDLIGYRSQKAAAVEPIVLRNDQLRGECIHLKDALEIDKDYADGVVDKLVAINQVLSQANLHIGYRVRDEVAIYMLYNKQLGLLDEDVALDYQVMQKILPRLQGSSQPIRRVLVQLLEICGGVKLSNTNDDLLTKLQEFEARGKAKPYPRSAAKLVSMLRRFEEDGFTSYWI